MDFRIHLGPSARPPASLIGRVFAFVLGFCFFVAAGILLAAGVAALFGYRLVSGRRPRTGTTIHTIDVTAVKPREPAPTIGRVTLSEPASGHDPVS